MNQITIFDLICKDAAGYQKVLQGMNKGEIRIFPPNISVRVEGIIKGKKVYEVTIPNPKYRGYYIGVADQLAADLTNGSMIY